MILTESLFISFRNSETDKYKAGWGTNDLQAVIGCV